MRRHYRCQAHSGEVRCTGERATWLCTAGGSITRLCEACHHDAGCCRQASELSRAGEKWGN